MAAIKTGENSIAVVPKPLRHPHIIHRLVQRGFKKPIKGEQGFLTSEGKFVGRVEALEIAKRAGQIKETPHSKLYTEDLW